MTPKQLLPRGAIHSPFSNRWAWDKKGGYAGATSIAVCLRKATAAGFVREERKDQSSPDGGTVGGAETYRIPAGDRLRVSSSYGATARDNRFSIEYIPATPAGDQGAT